MDRAGAHVRRPSRPAHAPGRRRRVALRPGDDRLVAVRVERRHPHEGARRDAREVGRRLPAAERADPQRPGAPEGDRALAARPQRRDARRVHDLRPREPPQAHHPVAVARSPHHEAVAHADGRVPLGVGQRPHRAGVGLRFDGRVLAELGDDVANRIGRDDLRAALHAERLRVELERRPALRRRERCEGDPIAERRRLDAAAHERATREEVGRGLDGARPSKARRERRRGHGRRRGMRRGIGERRAQARPVEGHGDEHGEGDRRADRREHAPFAREAQATPKRRGERRRTIGARRLPVEEPRRLGALVVVVFEQVFEELRAADVVERALDGRGARRRDRHLRRRRGRDRRSAVEDERLQRRPRARDAPFGLQRQARDHRRARRGAIVRDGPDEREDGECEELRARRHGGRLALVRLGLVPVRPLALISRHGGVLRVGDVSRAEDHVRARRVADARRVAGARPVPRARAWRRRPQRRCARRRIFRRLLLGAHFAFVLAIRREIWPRGLRPARTSIPLRDVPLGRTNSPFRQGEFRRRAWVDRRWIRRRRGGPGGAARDYFGARGLGRETASPGDHELPGTNIQPPSVRRNEHAEVPLRAARRALPFADVHACSRARTDAGSWR